VLVDKGTIAPQDRELLQFVDSPEEAFELLKEGLTRNHLIPEAERQAKPGVEEEEQLLRPEIARTL
jgi:predicted Rossmann-fold nucleotide-binding protein